MEPFTLFQFLQKLLPTEGVSEEKKSTPPKEQEVKNEPVSKTQSTEVPPVENAAALFLERHNERAKRTKRK